MDPKDVKLVREALSLIMTANRDEFMTWRNHAFLTEAQDKLEALLVFHNADEDEEVQYAGWEKPTTGTEDDPTPF